MKQIVDIILEKAGLLNPNSPATPTEWAASLLATKITQVLEYLDSSKSDKTHSHPEFGALSTKIDDETTRAASVEQNIDQRVTDEAQRAIGAETELTNKLNFENVRAIAAEKAAYYRVLDESQRASSAEAGLSIKIEAETIRATTAEDVIGRDVVNTRTILTQMQHDLSSETQQETVRAMSVESVLSSRIDTIISNTDVAALDSLSEVVTAFKSADSSIQLAISNLGTSSSSALGAEVARATDAENSLLNKINIEAARAIAVETTLATNKANVNHTHAEFTALATSITSKADVNHTHPNISGVPVGAMFAFPVTGNIPGYLKCDGSTYDAATYPILASMLTTFKPAGTANAKFCVPDTRGMHLRGADSGSSAVIDKQGLVDITTNASTTDTTRPGVKVADSLGKHGHGIYDGGHNHTVYDSGHSHGYYTGVDNQNPVYVNNFFGQTPVDDVGNVSGYYTQTFPSYANVYAVHNQTYISVLETGSAETRPKAVLVTYYIKHD